MIFGRKANSRKKERENNSRLNLVMAIIFLLIGAVLLRLFNLQVLQCDFYTALASSQHSVFSQLLPERGRIFIQDNAKGDNSELYPVAINKEFALVYAVPRDIEKPEEAAEKLYEIFDQAKIEKEVDELLSEDPYFKTETGVQLTGEEWKIKEEFKKIKRESEIKNRQEEVIKKYLQKLQKRNDPYEPLQSKVNEDDLAKLKELNIKGINYVMRKHRYYPDGNVGAQTLGFVGFSDEKEVGRYGLEGFFNEELSGHIGSVRTERSARGNPIIINDREYNKAENGSDLILTINHSIQYEACSRLAEACERHGSEQGTIIVMEPQTGAILAMCSWPDYNPNYYNEVEDINIYNNPAIFEQYEPGSIFKVMTMAAGLDQNKVQPYTLYKDTGQVMIEGWPKPIKNSDFETHGPHGIVDMNTVLELSLNTGVIHVMNQIGAPAFADYVKKFGFGEKTGIELETESAGDIRSLLAKKIRPVEVATATFGQGITATALQMISAYAAIANGGIMMQPYIVSTIISPDGTHHKTQPRQIERVISERAALLTSGMMVKVIDEGHAKNAAVKGYYVGGKTGTAQVAEKGGYSKDKTIHSFVGFAPADDPKFVAIVKLDDPKDVAWSDSSTAPLFSQVAKFILDYYQIPKQRD